MRMRAGDPRSLHNIVARFGKGHRIGRADGIGPDRMPSKHRLRLVNTVRVLARVWCDTILAATIKMIDMNAIGAFVADSRPFCCAIAGHCGGQDVVLA
jgi:hypothetical protein